MTLDWVFTFLYVTEESRHAPKIMSLFSYRDGNLQIVANAKQNQDYLEQMEKILNLISYLSFFPQKDFTKIQLTTPNNQHAVHYLDKRFIESYNMLGVFSVSEIDNSVPFKLWGVEEMMANYIFEYFLDWVKDYCKSDGNLEVPAELIDWLSAQIQDFYIDWKDAKNNHVSTSPSNDYFQSVFSVNNKKFEHWWDIQIINESGLPVTHVLSFLDKESFYYMDENENFSQNITSMSISALKFVIDEHGGDWNIDYLKSELNNEMGFQYTFFKKFSIINNDKILNLMLIMNSGLFNLEDNKYVQVLTGREFDFLEKFSKKLQVHPKLFTEDAVLCNFEEDQEKIHSILLECVKNCLG